MSFYHQMEMQWWWVTQIFNKGQESAKEKMERGEMMMLMMMLSCFLESKSELIDMRIVFQKYLEIGKS